MELITKRDKIAGIAQAWREQYKRGENKIWQQLKALPPTATEQDIAAIIGNGSWTRNECTECGQDADVVVQMGEEPDWESSTIYACPQCLKRALALAGE